MDAIKKHQQISHYEGLVRKTAAKVTPYVEDDYDEICQFLREKVWKGLTFFTPERVRKTSKYSPAQQCERFVFSCLLNGVKDLRKKKRRDWLFIEDTSNREADRASGDQDYHGEDFDSQYLSVEDAYPSFADIPLIPSTLDQVERTILYLTYAGFNTAEIALQESMPKRDVLDAAASIREKMADWKPGSGEDVPMPIAA